MQSSDARRLRSYQQHDSCALVGSCDYMKLVLRSAMPFVTSETIWMSYKYCLQLQRCGDWQTRRLYTCFVYSKHGLFGTVILIMLLLAKCFWIHRNNCRINCQPIVNLLVGYLTNLSHQLQHAFDYYRRICLILNPCSSVPASVSSSYMTLNEDAVYKFSN
jgi:hypothetical protein